ncbi:MAG: NAD(P)-binding domain-containing protein [Spirochaetia bacterium]|nr:NAD(P)-binding domain-containing protein [Spirochaetia bacterium]
MTWLLIVIAILVIVSFLLYNFASMGMIGKKSSEAYKNSLKNQIKPLTRHPVIDHSICILCGSCIRACPETHGDDSPLGIVDGRLLLVNPAKCVGHAQCEMQCPTGAMTVTLGELAADPNMPVLTKNNETIVPGIFIAGELSGVPLVKNAIDQGNEVIKYIALKASAEESGDSEIFDVVIVGLGPSGLSATLSAHEHKLKYVTIEQRAIGGTVSNYPKQKMIMTSPINLPLYGTIKKSEIQKEELIDIWNSMVKKYNLNLHVGEKVESIFSEANGKYFNVSTNTAAFKTKNVILCLGRRGTPRKLGIKGEELLKVTYGLIDPDAYQKKKIIVVGGGDSAIEAAVVLSKNNEVILSYRKDSFFRVKDKNMRAIKNAEENGSIKIMLNSELTEITEKNVSIKINEDLSVVENDYVFVLIGGEPPFPLLRSMGIIKDTEK